MTTEQCYNAKARQIGACVDCYFWGSANDPLSISHNNFLISYDLLEELTGDTTFPVGAPSANMLTATLRNTDGIFNPLNTSSPYAALIKQGMLIKCRSLIKNEQVLDETAMGEFYLYDWKLSEDRMTIEVTAYDKLFDILNQERPKLPVMHTTRADTFLQEYLESLGGHPSLWMSMTQTAPIWPYIFATDEVRKVLTSFNMALCGYLYYNRQGVLTGLYNLLDLDGEPGDVDPDAPVPARHTITDADQILGLSTANSLHAEYDGYEVAQYKWAPSEQMTLVETKGEKLPAGNSTLEYLLSKLPADTFLDLQLSLAVVGNPYPKVRAFLGSAHTISIEVNSPLDNMEVDVIVSGQALISAITQHSSGGQSPIKVDSVLIQTDDQITRWRTWLTRYLSVYPYQIIELSVRGNPTFQLGDIIHVDSVRFGLSFDGILLRQSFSYNGGLTSTITLLNKNIWGG